MRIGAQSRLPKICTFELGNPSKGNHRVVGLEHEAPPTKGLRRAEFDRYIQIRLYDKFLFASSLVPLSSYIPFFTLFSCFSSPVLVRIRIGLATRQSAEIQKAHICKPKFRNRLVCLGPKILPGSLPEGSLTFERRKSKEKKLLTQILLVHLHACVSMHAP